MVDGLVDREFLPSQSAIDNRQSEMLLLFAPGRFPAAERLRTQTSARAGSAATAASNG
jgi:hypothetical protein